MTSIDTPLLRGIERLIVNVQALIETAPSKALKERAQYTLKCMAALGHAVLKQRDIFGIEPWHVIDETVPLDAPGEYLLRLKDHNGNHMPPYPAIITFYENGMASDIDTVLFLCALKQFERSDETQISVNVSARSLQNAEFIKTVLQRIERAPLTHNKTLIIEIHETTPELKMSQDVLKLFRNAGVLFAMDDVGLSMGDVLRMSEFDEIADFIKLDRNSVCAHPEKPNALDHVISFVTSLLPNATIVAEGVKSAEHARELKEHHPHIKYVQGLHLPVSRDEFNKDWKAQREKVA